MDCIVFGFLECTKRKEGVKYNLGKDVADRSRAENFYLKTFKIFENKEGSQDAFLKLNTYSRHHLCYAQINELANEG